MRWTCWCDVVDAQRTHFLFVRLLQHIKCVECDDNGTQHIHSKEIINDVRIHTQSEKFIIYLLVVFIENILMLRYKLFTRTLKILCNYVRNAYWRWGMQSFGYIYIYPFLYWFMHRSWYGDIDLHSNTRCFSAIIFKWFFMVKFSLRSNINELKSMVITFFDEEIFEVFARSIGIELQTRKNVTIRQSPIDKADTLFNQFLIEINLDIMGEWSTSIYLYQLFSTHKILIEHHLWLEVGRLEKKTPLDPFIKHRYPIV